MVLSRFFVWEKVIEVYVGYGVVWEKQSHFENKNWDEKK